MKIKGITDEDFVNYKKPSMFIAFPHCSFKCDKDCNMQVCQNSTLANAPTIDVPIKSVVKRYMSNPISQAIVCGGLEPFDSFCDLSSLIAGFREYTNDDIVIYSGYNKNEIYLHKTYKNLFNRSYPNIIVKFGRYIPGRPQIFDAVLGVNLASDNQYAERIT